MAPRQAKNLHTPTNTLSQHRNWRTSQNMHMIGLGIAAVGAGLGMGLIGYGALTGMSRQPDAIPRLQIVMLIALAFVELVFLLSVFIAPSSFVK